MNYEEKKHVESAGGCHINVVVNFLEAELCCAVWRRKEPGSHIRTLVLNSLWVLPVSGALCSSNWKTNEGVCRFLPGERCLRKAEDCFPAGLVVEDGRILPRLHRG